MKELGPLLQSVQHKGVGMEKVEQWYFFAMCANGGSGGKKIRILLRETFSMMDHGVLTKKTSN